MFRRNASTLLSCFLALVLVQPTLAQTTHTFSWGLNDTLVAKNLTLTSCSPYKINISSLAEENGNTQDAVPPYQLLAFEMGGTPRRYPLGSDTDNMVWESDFPSGKQVVLNIIDSLGSSGGTSQLLVTKGDGDCVAQDTPSSSFTVSVNVTDRLETCQPWQMSVSGGTPPYIFILAAPDAPVVSNVTGTGDVSQFTYINRAYPDGQLFVAVADSDRYASGTPIVATYGASTFECAGAMNSWGSSSSGSAADPSSNAKSNKSTIALAVAIPIGALIVLASAFFVYRRRQQQKDHEARGETSPYLLDRPPGVFPAYPTTLPPSKGLPEYTNTMSTPASGSTLSSPSYLESSSGTPFHRPRLRMVNEDNEEIDLAHLVNVLQNAQEPPPPYATGQRRQNHKPGQASS